jgi:hypothetical protein
VSLGRGAQACHAQADKYRENRCNQTLMSFHEGYQYLAAATAKQ